MPAVADHHDAGLCGRGHGGIFFPRVLAVCPGVRPVDMPMVRVKRRMATAAKGQRPDMNDRVLIRADALRRKRLDTHIGTWVSLAGRMMRFGLEDILSAVWDALFRRALLSLVGCHVAFLLTPFSRAEDAFLSIVCAVAARITAPA